MLTQTKGTPLDVVEGKGPEEAPILAQTLGNWITFLQAMALPSSKGGDELSSKESVLNTTKSSLDPHMH